MTLVDNTMGYQFKGYFFKGFKVKHTTLLDKSYEIRTIEEPFQGSGILIEGLSNMITLDEIVELAEKLPIPKNVDWLFIEYDCWAGRIDYILGLTCIAGQINKLIEEDRMDFIDEAYIKLMQEFQISKEIAINFKPFERGFWGSC